MSIKVPKEKYGITNFYKVYRMTAGFEIYGEYREKCVNQLVANGLVNVEKDTLSLTDLAETELLIIPVHQVYSLCETDRSKRLFQILCKSCGLNVPD